MEFIKRSWTAFYDFVSEYGIQAPNEHCSFRYTNFVEVIAPVISTDALRALVVDCKDCIHRKTVWGLDNVWCGFVANQLSLSSKIPEGRAWVHGGFIK